jgi:integrin beta 3
VSQFDGAAFGLKIVEMVKGHLQPLRDALDAAKAENVALRARIDVLEARSAVPGPEGQPGKDGAVGPAGEPGAPGRDGTDGAPGLDGKDGAPGRDGSTGPAGKDGEPGRDGRDGVDGAPGLDGRDGAPGPAGPQGPQGERGPSGLQGERGLQGEQGLPGRDGQPGVPGRDGKDGLGFDDLDVDYDGARTFTFRLQRGDRTKEFAFTVPVMLYQGVWQERSYEPGDSVTWRGSLWVARAATDSKPDEASTAWTLCAKKGRDGKDAARGAF